MKIIILGCGKVGTVLAEQLILEGHDITVVDRNEKVLRNLCARLDIMGVTGNSAMLDTLIEAGVREADIMMAVTDSDEINMLSCLIAKKEGHCQTVARVRDPEYEKELNYLQNEMNLGLVINPDKMAAHEIIRLLNFPSALQIETFAKGQVDMIKMRLNADSPLCNVALSDLSKHITSNVLIACVERGDEVLIPSGKTVLLEGDAISFIASAREAVTFCKECKLEYAPIRNAFIVGGGKEGYYIASSLQNNHSKCDVKIVEIDEERCKFLSDAFPDVTVIHGDGTNRNLLLEEGVSGAEAFIALTGNDEENIIMSMLNKGATPKTVHNITKIDYLDPVHFVNNPAVGSVVCSKKIVADAVVRFVRALEQSSDANMEKLYTIANGRAEAAEFLVYDEPELVGIPFSKMNLKENTLVAAIIRKKEMIRPTGSDCMKSGDRVIIITSNSGLRDLRDILR